MTTFIKRQGMPKILEDIYVDFHWSQTKLWNLELPMEKLAIDKLDWILDYPVWYLDINSIPRKILENPELDPTHWNRILKADLNFPIHVINWKGRMVIMDGIHRLIKAKISKVLELDAKILNSSHIANIMPDPEDFERGFLKQVQLK